MIEAGTQSSLAIAPLNGFLDRVLTVHKLLKVNFIGLSRGGFYTLDDTEVVSRCVFVRFSEDGCQGFLAERRRIPVCFSGHTCTLL